MYDLNEPTNIKFENNFLGAWMDWREWHHKK